jgi:hypothetical protein
MTLTLKDRLQDSAILDGNARALTVRPDSFLRAKSSGGKENSVVILLNSK